MPDTAPPPIGHNQAPAGADPLQDRLNTDHTKLITRRDALLGGIARAPAVISDEETAGKMADFVEKQLDAFLDIAGDVHTSEKAPYLAGGRTVDAFWHSLIDAIAAGKKNLNVARKAYADKKTTEERQRREEAARIAHEEAERLQRHAAAAADAVKTEAQLPAAITLQETAVQAAAIAAKATEAAAAKPAELGRSVGAGGGTTTLRKFWNFADLDRAKLDLEALRPHLSNDVLEKAIRAWITANKADLDAKTAKLPVGVRIFEDTRI